MTMGMLMHYGGAAGAVLGIIIMLFLSKVFAVQRSKLKKISAAVKNKSYNNGGI